MIAQKFCAKTQICEKKCSLANKFGLYWETQWETCFPIDQLADKENSAQWKGKLPQLPVNKQRIAELVRMEARRQFR